MNTFDSSEIEGTARSTKLGNELKQLRDNSHLSLATVEGITRISASYIHRLEKSERTPSLKILHALALCYGVNLSELIKTALADERASDIINQPISHSTRHSIIELIKVTSLNNLDYFDSLQGIKTLAVASQNFLNSVKNDGIGPKLT